MLVKNSWRLIGRSVNWTFYTASQFFELGLYLFPQTIVFFSWQYRCLVSVMLHTAEKDPHQVSADLRIGKSQILGGEMSKKTWRTRRRLLLPLGSNVVQLNFTKSTLSLVENVVSTCQMPNRPLKTLILLFAPYAKVQYLLRHILMDGDGFNSSRMFLQDHVATQNYVKCKYKTV